MTVPICYNLRHESRLTESKGNTMEDLISQLNDMRDTIENLTVRL